MRRSGFWVALVVFLALFAWIRFVEMRPRPKAVVPADSLFLAVPALNVRVITVTYLGDTTRIERRPAGWVITEPVQYPADSIPITALLSRCEKFPALRAFPLPPGEEPRYGLDAPSCRVTLEEATGRRTTLLMGAPAPATPAYFVQVQGVPRVGLLRETEADAFFRRETTGWRVPTLVACKPSTVCSVRLRWEERRVRLERGTPRERWRVVEPFAGLASAPVMEEYLTGVAHMAALDFPDDHPIDLARYGLARPAGEMRLIDATGDTATLWIGAVYPDHPGAPARFARAAGNPVIFAVPAGYAGLLQHGDLYFRDRHLLRRGIGQFQAFSVSDGRRTITLRPDSLKAWRAADEPAGDGAGMDRRALVESWVVARADSLLPADGTPVAWLSGPPSLTLEARGVDTAVERIDVWPMVTGGPSGERWPARVKSAELPRPDEVFLLPGELVRPALALLRQPTAGSGAVPTDRQ